VCYFVEVTCNKRPAGFLTSAVHILALQIGLALVTAGSSLYLASKTGDQSKIYIAAGLGMAAMLPYTVICIFPTNHRLMSADKKEDTEVTLYAFLKQFNCILAKWMPLQSRKGPWQDAIQVMKIQLPVIKLLGDNLHDVQHTEVCSSWTSGQATVWQVGETACSANGCGHSHLCWPHHRRLAGHEEIIPPPSNPSRCVASG
jgi:hypothetical protein